VTTWQGTSRDEIGSERAEEFAREHPNLVKLGRVGWVAKGIVYGLMGALAIAIALQSSDASADERTSGQQEASASGAIAAIADQPAGAALLVVIAVGLGLYVLWRLVSLMLPAENDADAWLTRVGYAISAVGYSILAWTAISFARHPGTGDASEEARIEGFTRDLLENSAGRIAVFVLGAILIGTGLYFLYKGAAATFESELAPGGVGPVSHDTLVTLGRVGWIGRGLMIGLIGFFFARAAVMFDADEAEGLDGALRRVSGSTLGTVLILVVAAGLIVYGLFCAISAPRQRLTGAD
jgi:Domain of Unknown Function (DUF1206)